jgi:hypothetical protein
MNLIKKGQEETAGFVIIIVIVCLILVIFLSLSLKNNEAPERQSSKVSSFLKGIRVVTTDCMLSGNTYADIEELLKLCYLKKSCTNAQEPCKLLNTTLDAIFNASIPYGATAFIKGYSFKANYVINSTKNEFLSKSAGNCTSTYNTAEEFIILSPGKIRYSFKECY